MDVRRMGLKEMSKREVYNTLAVKGNIYLPPMHDTNCDYVADIIAGRKKFNTGALVPNLEESSPLWDMFALKKLRKSTPRKNVIMEETKEQVDEEELSVNKSKNFEEEKKLPNSALKSYFQDISESDY